MKSWYLCIWNIFACVLFLFANVTAKIQGGGEDALRLITGENQGYEVKKKKGSEGN